MKNENELEHAQKILNRINESIASDPKTMPDFQMLRDTEYPSILSDLIFLLTNIRMEESEAEKTLKETFSLRLRMGECLGRPVDFRVSLLDLLLGKKDFFQDPKVIEIKLYLEQQQKAVVDYLTGLYNRRYFDEALQREANQAKRYNRSFSLLLIDIDDFKKINDERGHRIGDEVLKNLAKIIQSNTRKEDTICRTGGEEFTLILPDTISEGALNLGEKIRTAFHGETIADRKLSFSGGIANYPGDSRDLDELVHLSDKAMYYSKYNGKNRITIMTETIRSSPVLKEEIP
jgi:diguanylate cyclase (GGDEF)-like protein